MIRKRKERLSLLFLLLYVSSQFSCKGYEGREREARDSKVFSKSHVVRKGDVPEKVLHELNLEGDKLKVGLRGLKKLDPWGRIFPGDSITVILDSLYQPESLFLVRGPFERLMIPLDGREPERVSLPLQRRLRAFRIIVKENLTLSFLDEGLPTKVLLKYADLFTWDIDFYTETRRGDTAEFLVETYFSGEKRVDFGRILAASYKGSKTGNHRAYFFSFGDSSGYFDERGNSVRRAFLKSPLPFGRIASRFTRRRFHPILKRWRPHHGLDYAAPYGTPAFAVASGVVVFAGWKGDYGKLVRIRHSNGYVTGYGHLARIRVRKGRRVNQGDIIGYVGSTGLSTGPHLHYEVMLRGRFVNPSTLRLPPSFRLGSDTRRRFLFERDRIQGTLDLLLQESLEVAKGS